MNAGYTPSGDLVVEMHSDFPADDFEGYLLVRKSDHWSPMEEMHCGRFGDCAFKQKFSGHDLGAYREDDKTELWNLSADTNPYIVSVSKQDANKDDGYEFTVAFKINGKTTQLKFIVFPGPDTGDALTEELTFITSEGKPIMITDEQFDATIQGRFLLFDGYSGDGASLIDLVDGTTVLDHFNGDVIGWLPQ